jgi:general secretion pathway protein A
VQWLERQLSLIQGRKARPLKNPVFDDTMVKQVKKFQLAKGLVPDGIVGKQTIIHLNTEIGSGEPVLIGRWEEKENVLHP